MSSLIKNHPQLLGNCQYNVTIIHAPMKHPAYLLDKIVRKISLSIFWLDGICIMCPFLTHLTPSLQQLFDMPEQKMEIPILSKVKMLVNIAG